MQLQIWVMDAHRAPTQLDAVDNNVKVLCPRLRRCSPFTKDEVNIVRVGGRERVVAGLQSPCVPGNKAETR